MKPHCFRRTDGSVSHGEIYESHAEMMGALGDIIGCVYVWEVKTIRRENFAPHHTLSIDYSSFSAGVVINASFVYESKTVLKLECFDFMTWIVLLDNGTKDIFRVTQEDIDRHFNDYYIRNQI